jgi:hypothetical protein
LKICVAMFGADRWQCRLEVVQGLAASLVQPLLDLEDENRARPTVLHGLARVPEPPNPRRRKLALFGDDTVRGEPELDMPAATGSSGDAAYLEHMQAAFSGEGSRRAARDPEPLLVLAPRCERDWKFEHDSPTHLPCPPD